MSHADPTPLRTLRVAVLGHGATGQAICRLLASRPAVQVCGVADANPARVGLEVAGLPHLQVAPALAPAADADVVVFATTSRVTELVVDAEPWLAASVNVVSICEELGYPWRSHPDEARRLDSAARAGGVSVLGTGVNPGFVMDLFPLLCSATLEDVRTIEVTRTIDLADYGALIWRFGLGADEDEFGAKLERGEIVGHVGFEQSLAHLADVAGLEVDEIVVDAPAPAAHADTERVGASNSIGAGTVCAIRQEARGTIGGDVVIRLTEYFAFRPQPGEIPLGDGWRITSSARTLELASPPGVPSLGSTVALTCNVLAAAVEARPGLVSMTDLPVALVAAPGARAVAEASG